MDFDLKRVLRALLFSTSEPLSAKDIKRVIAAYHDSAEPEDDQEELEGISIAVPSLLTGTQIEDAAAELAAELEDSGDVFRLRAGPRGYFLTVNDLESVWVRLLRGQPKPQRLTTPVLETLAIVAYRQPVTRAEIEAIRGVSADSALGRLQERELIEVIGRAELPGRPLQYGTSEAFLEYCGLRHLDELPASDVLSPRAIESWLDDAIQGRPQAPSTEELGLSSAGSHPETEAPTPGPEADESDQIVPETEATVAVNPSGEETRPESAS